MKSIGWYKNQWLAIDEILIPANDRGLKFADGIFETILIKKNKPVLLDEHIKRLEKSSKILNISFKVDKLFLKRLFHEGITKLALKNDQLKPNFSPISTFISKTEKRNEFSLLSKCKTFSYNQAIQVLSEAHEKYYDDSIILNTCGELCCGSTFNLLIKRNKKWITPRKESGCLEGIMVDKALQLNIAKEELIFPKFQANDIVLAINSLSCRQINKINDLYFKSDFDPIYFWDLLYN